MARGSSRSRNPNFIAATILATTVAVLYANFDPVPAGKSPASISDREFFDVEEFIVPMPPEAIGLAEAVELPEATELPVVDSNPEDCDTTDAPVAFAPSTLSNTELIEYSLMLLKDGAGYLKQFETYTAVFHKQERLGGDLSEVETLDVKIRQTPSFAVYMKWRNGDRGRQLLYSEEYEDGDMVVKLGGFKGRLLPGLKLNPKGPKALGEARHPVTQAGILGMADRMIADRRHNLAQSDGVKCTRLPNQEFNQRDCFCFLYEYDSPQISKDYRKSLILLDTKHHIPVMVRNYTWAAEPNDWSAEDLDALTLIENYSFTDIDFAKTVTALEFSRDNPRYRM